MKAASRTYAAAGIWSLLAHATQLAGSVVLSVVVVRSLSVEQLGELDVHISVLSPLEPLEVDSEASLIASLRPKLDGLVVREGERLGTFLPAVWESLPDPRAFVEEVKRKAGLPADYWSSSLRFFRYTVESLP